MNKTTMLIYHEWAKLFKEMSAEDTKTILLALLEFDATGKEPPVYIESELIFAIYKMMLEKTEKNRSLYAEKCEKNAKNGALGGRPKKSENPKKPDRIGREGIGEDRIGMDRMGGERNNTVPRPPSLPEVRDYCIAEGLAAVDPDRFWNYYDSKNWLIDGEPMNWQARLKVWNSQDAEKKKTTSFSNFDQRTYNYDELEEKLINRG